MARRSRVCSSATSASKILRIHRILRELTQQSGFSFLRLMTSELYQNSSSELEPFNLTSFDGEVISFALECSSLMVDDTS